MKVNPYMASSMSSESPAVIPKFSDSPSSPMERPEENGAAENSELPSPAKRILQANRKLRIDGSKSPEKCSICLSVPEDRAYTDSCYHEFCFVCLVEWSKVKAECPLCKQNFKNIIHNVRSATDYDKYAIPEEAETFGIDDAGRRFRYPSTMTVERAELLRLIRQLHLQMQEMQRSSQILERNRYMYLRQLERIRRLRHLFERSAERREHLTATSDFRRVVYERRLRTIPPAAGERVRVSNPEFYHRNPACVNRLTPWLHRELSVLMAGESGRVQFLMGLIQQMLLRWPIDGAEFRRFLLPYMGSYTDLFTHEFYNFARSPYDMDEYDRRVQYESWRDARARQRGPNDPPPEIVIGSSPSPERRQDSDVDVDVDVVGSDSSVELFRNPSPPRNPWTADHDYRTNASQERRPSVQTMIDRLLHRHRSVEHALQRRSALLPRYFVSQPRRVNAEVDILTSSSDEDDSPRLDPNARTPPFLLQPRKRPSILGMATTTKRRLVNPAASASSIRRGLALSPVLLDDSSDNSVIAQGVIGSPFHSVPTFSPTRAPPLRVGDAFAVSTGPWSTFGFPSTSAARTSNVLDDSSPLLLSTPSESGTPLYDENPLLDHCEHFEGGHRESASNFSAISPSSWKSPYSQNDTVYLSPDLRDSPTLRQSSGSERTSVGRSVISSIHHRDYTITPTSESLTNLFDDSYRSRSQSRSPSPIDPNEIQIIDELKPKHLRTPELIVLGDEDDESDVDKKPSTSELASAVDDGPTTSGLQYRRRSSSKERKRSHKSHRRHHHRHSRHRHGSDSDRDRRHRHRDPDYEDRHHRHRQDSDDYEDRHRRRHDSDDRHGHRQGKKSKKEKKSKRHSHHRHQSHRHGDH